MLALYDLPAPAKLNLFLHITGRRADGYHLLESAFMLIDWCDTVHLELRTDGVISREDIDEHGNVLPKQSIDNDNDNDNGSGSGSGSASVLPDDDLCVRAARALQAATGTRLGVHIRLCKRIPTQAGMGGGSSDAATCLLGLNRLWNLLKQLSFLQQIGQQLGADVAFFLGGRNAWVQGVGEQLTPIDLPAAQFVVIKPLQGLSTPEIFGHSALKRDSPHAIISGFAADPYGFGHNDLQPVAQMLNPQVTQAINLLRNQRFKQRFKQGLNQVLQPRMTGSGSAVFAKISGDENLAAVPLGWQQKVCSNLSAHPLIGWAI
jgi:4-diphosphocytidyl-2-C-methyl-D-erythritol kinase